MLLCFGGSDRFRDEIKASRSRTTTYVQKHLVVIYVRVCVSCDIWARNGKFVIFGYPVYCSSAPFRSPPLQLCWHSQRDLTFYHFEQ